MEPLSSLLQTVLWVALIGGIVWRFHKPLDALMSALTGRIESGSDLKAGPFAITHQLRPQDPAAQAKKVEEEIREEARLALPPLGKSVEMPRAPAHSATALRSKHFEAEDLALRAVQNEYGVPINRQLTAGRDMGFDGAFVKHNTFHIVEIRLTSGKHPRPVIARAASQVSKAAELYNWSSVKVLVVLVVLDEERLAEAKAQIENFVPNSSYPVEVRCYSFGELRSMFRLAVENG